MAMELGIINGGHPGDKFEWKPKSHVRSYSKEELSQVNYFLYTRTRLLSEIPSTLVVN